ncbi:MAG TPA: serine/threonine-protein kinase [Pseudolabrys sp.]|nr:serine/threonine-protein kinase [Pseudolabrys sp.]
MDERTPSSGDAEHYFALPPGSRLQEFEIESVLGHGGFGITYLAKDTLLDQAVAIKEYFPNELAVRVSDATVSAKSRADEDDFSSGLQSFLEEARTLARFRANSIVTVRRFFKANGTGYIVQDYVQGQTLTRRINAAPLLEPELRQILLGLLDGLEVVHDRATLHRDIKPDNIILRDDGTPVLIDFGAARSYLGRHSRSITAIAAGGYTPPEQWGAGGQHGPWSDIYALGAVAYRCVTGTSPPVSLQRLRNDPMSPASVAAAGKYSPQLLALIDSMLQVDESKRPTSISAVRDALLGRSPDAADAPTVMVSKPATQPSKPRWLRPLLATAAALLVLIGGVAAYVVHERQAYADKLAQAGSDPLALAAFVKDCAGLCPAELRTTAQARIDALVAAQKEEAARQQREAEAARRRELDDARQRVDALARQRAADEQAKAREQTRQQEQARQQAERAAAEQAAKQREREAQQQAQQAQPVQQAAPQPQQQARLEQAPPPAPQNPIDMIKSLQGELRRVGCYSGSADGEWTPALRQGLELFNRHAGMQIETRLASADAIDAVRMKTTRICPLVCERGFHADGERCVATVCDAGFALVDGRCQRSVPVPKRAAAPTQRARAEPSASSSGGPRCFNFNGRRYCE